MLGDKGERGDNLAAGNDPKVFGTRGTETFKSTDNKRVDNNPILPEDYKGPDDVSLRYRALSEQEKQDMGRIKFLSQQLINEIRKLDASNLMEIVVAGVVVQQESPNKYIEKAVDNVQLGAMYAIKFLTGPK